MRAALAFVLALAYSPSWVPTFERTLLRIRAGDTGAIRVTPVQAGWPAREAAPSWNFRSTNPDIARVDGSLRRVAAYDIPVTGLAPGKASLVVDGADSSRPTVTISVYCDDGELLNATPEVQTLVGRTAALRVETPEADRTAFTWYRGRIGDTSQPIAGAAGPQLEVTPLARGTEHYWVWATTTCTRQSAEFAVAAHAPKQRAARR